MLKVNPTFFKIKGLVLECKKNEKYNKYRIKIQLNNNEIQQIYCNYMLKENTICEISGTI